MQCNYKSLDNIQCKRYSLINHQKCWQHILKKYNTKTFTVIVLNVE